MTLSLVVAAAKNNVIGKDNQLLWRLPNDMRFFKNITWAMPVIMGRKTFESLPIFLKNRRVYVASKDGYSFYPTAGQKVALGRYKTLKQFIESNISENLWIIGGGEIYKQALEEDVVDEVYLSEFEKLVCVDKGDVVYFPPLPKSFVLTQEQEFTNYKLKIYTR